MLHPKAIQTFIQAKRDSHAWVKGLTDKQLDDELKCIGFRAARADPPLDKHQKACLLLGVAYTAFSFWLDMGTGKTRLSLELLRYLMQLGEIRHALVLCPSEQSVYGWEKQIAEWHIDIPYVALGNSPSADKWAQIDELPIPGFIICTYPGLVWLLSKRKPKKSKGKEVKKNGKTVMRVTRQRSLVDRLCKNLDAIVCDECFVAGSRVSTPTGLVPIERLKVGGIVCTSNGPKQVRRLLIKNSNVITSLHLSNGQTIKCTPNHPFFTDKGWVCAGNLEGSFLYDNKSVQDLFQGNIGLETAHVLQQILYSEMAQAAPSMAQGQEARPNVRGNQTAVKGNSRNADNYCRNTGQAKCGIKGQTSSLGKGQTILEQGCTNAVGIKKKIKRIFAGYRAWYSRSNAWWEWEDNSAAANGHGRIRLALETGARHYIGEEAARLSNLLQSGPCSCAAPDCNRGGWGRTQAAQKFGFKERCQAGRIGVVRVENNKLHNSVPVFTLEVEETPHFFVEDCLVHNSTKLGNHGSLQYMAVRALRKRVKWYYNLAGRPFGRDPQMVWTQQWLVDFGESLGDTLELFRQAFYTEKRGYFGGFEYKLREDMRPILAELMGHRSISYDESECGSKVPVKVVVEEVLLPEDIESYYRKATEAVWRARGNRNAMKNVFLRMRQLSSGFVGFKDDETGERVQITFPVNPKLERLVDLVEAVPLDRKFVIFHEFTHSGRLLCDKLKQMGIKHGWLWGGQKNSRSIQDQFDNEAKMRALVVNARLGAMSLNLQVANYQFDYENPVSVIDKEQMDKRLPRKGQKRTVYRYELVCKGTVDQKILDFHASGEDLFQALLRDPYEVGL